MSEDTTQEKLSEDNDEEEESFYERLHNLVYIAFLITVLTGIVVLWVTGNIVGSQFFIFSAVAFVVGIVVGIVGILYSFTVEAFPGFDEGNSKRYRKMGLKYGFGIAILSFLAIVVLVLINIVLLVGNTLL